jgi:hypothetical protein
VKQILKDFNNDLLLKFSKINTLYIKNLCNFATTKQNITDMRKTMAFLYAAYAVYLLLFPMIF